MDHGSSPRYARDRSASTAGAGSPVVGAVVAACIAGLLGVLILAGAVATSARDGGGTTLSPSGDAPAGPSPSSPSTPTWRRASYRRAGFDKSFKADLIDELPTPPELVVFGGSRATRFEPSYLASLTGLSTFNCAVQCFRPEDAWAYSNYLYSRAPDTRLHCIIALQTRTFHDDTLRAGLLYDQRLASAFPPALVSRQKKALGRPPVKELLSVNRFLPRGYLVRNRYDVARERPGYSFRKHLDLYIRRLLPQHRWDGPLGDARSRTYFEKTVRLYNDHDVVPLIVVMPYQPRVLRAFRAAGFQKHLDRLTAYLRAAGTRCRFRVLDLTDIRTYGGKATWFYDGAHVTRQNAHQIARYAAAAAPECFK
jgi:hypothetical protein